MVSIRKAKQGFQLRQRNNNNRGNNNISQADKEKLGLLVGGLCIAVLWLIFFSASAGGGDDSSSSFLDSTTNSGAANIGDANFDNNNPLRHRKPHPQLILEDEDEEEEDQSAAAAKNKNNPAIISPQQQRQVNNNSNNNNQNASPATKKKKAGEQKSFVSEAFNAMALDILETLECDKLFDETLQKLKKKSGGGGGEGGGGGDFGDDNSMIAAAEEDDQQNRRFRRLLLQENNQHGDDGGFENLDSKDPPEKADGGEQRDDDTKEEEEEDGGDAEEEKWGREAMGNADMMNGMDDAPGFDFKQDDQGGGNGDDYFGGYSATRLSAKHLFCLAAMQEPPTEIVSEFSCAASGRKRKTLLDLWTSARAQISDVALLKKVLELALEQKSQGILGRTYNLWAPKDDTGMKYMINTLNNELLETLNLLEPSLGPDKLFVDVGSGMGLTTMAISNKYPGTKIVSIEPASPNWLLQELNLRCNLSKQEFTKIKVVLAGVGPNTDDEDNMMAKLMWRATSTTSTRAWTPKEEFGPDDVELLVRLRKLRSILAEADVYLTHDHGSSTPNMMDVLNLDCQGCEYNLIPALTEEEFDAIPNVMGGVHWGYIPLSKLPSSQRGRQTHDRLCQHETIAKTTKECCGSLNMPVKSNIPGEVLYRDNGPDKKPEVVTVSDIIQEGLCNDYDTWAKEHYVNTIKDDWGWFELSSQAQ